jgi:hypothetical protein
VKLNGILECKFLPKNAHRTRAHPTDAAAGRVNGNRNNPSLVTQLAFCQSSTAIGPVSNVAEAAADLVPAAVNKVLVLVLVVVVVAAGVHSEASECC